MQHTKLFSPSAVWPLVFWVLFAVVYAVIFSIHREAAIEQYQYTVSRIPSIELYGSDTANTLLGYAKSFGIFIGVGFGFLYAVSAYILLGIASLVRLTSQKFGAMLTFLFATIPVDVVAYLIHTQPQARTAISAVLAKFVSIPLWYSTLTLVVVLTLLFILSFVYGKSTPKQNT